MKAIIYTITSGALIRYEIAERLPFVLVEKWFYREKNLDISHGTYIDACSYSRGAMI
jgi:hypothetical protein